MIKYQWLATLLSIEEDLDLTDAEIKVNQIELSRWETKANGKDGDLAKNQTYLVTLERQKNINKVINTLNDRKKELLKQKENVLKLIDRFNGLDHEILKLKYVEGYTLEVVARTLSYDYQYIKNKHAHIMKMIKFSEGK
ncbi:sigma-70 family RNA polymerase sigma factor [Marinilactibacillus sp. XAAS-LB27]|uniref:sigma-70 family RNA polymerase sigma factor n=1 Tax=Marinilactibacillus sp. XAAS-LB27 TaxID=3114538 RepID=UPI002E19DF28|nr:sigma-70 family RNA polymerase sigma factor [Marinilactibacillus sp. XAAS-LB27]